MPSEAPKFKTNDKVFAKVRGYPPWPARVEGIADETPNKLRYHIFFYGTREIGVCRQEELYPYLLYKEKYGKGVKRKFFPEALKEIEDDFINNSGEPKIKGPSGNMTAHDSEEETDDSEEEGLVINEYKEKKPKGRASVSKTKNDNFDKMDTDTPYTPSSVVKVTTSGRKIKPKKTYDPDDDESFSNQTTNVQSPALPNVVDNAVIYTSVVRAVTPDDEYIILDINNFTPPEHCKTEKALTLWKMNKIHEFEKVKEKIEKGEPVSDIYQKIIDEQTQPHVQAEIEAKEDFKTSQLQIELNLLQIDLEIKEALHVDSADCDQCLEVLDRLLELPVTALMLKKHPEIMDTCKKLQHYKGNTMEWDMTQDELDDFITKSAEIRAKANQFYNKVKTLFTVPFNEDFWQNFANELINFNEMTKNMPTYDLFKLCHDPTAVLRERNVN